MRVLIPIAMAQEAGKKKSNGNTHTQANWHLVVCKLTHTRSTNIIDLCCDLSTTYVWKTLRSCVLYV